MDVPKATVDRILQAMSPALAAELSLIVSEVQQAVEADYENRMKATIEDVRERAMEKGAYELQLAVDEARDTVRAQVTQEQQQQLEELRRALDHKHSETTAGFDSERAEWNTEKAQLQQQLEEWKTFADAQRQLLDAGSQAEILIRWLKLAEPFAPSIAVYTMKPGGLALWKSRGTAVFPEIVSRETIDPEFYFRSVTVRGATVAAVCASHGGRVDVLDYLVQVMELAIEVFGLRLRNPVTRTDAETARVR